MTDTVRIDALGPGMVKITLARPAKLNALDDAMIAQLGAAAARIEAEPSVRVVILTGEGKMFCAGGDIAAWGNLSPFEMGQRWIREGNRVFDSLARLRPPVIAALNGSAFGGGLELAATADIRVAEAGSLFGLPETGVGTVPGWSGTQRLARRFGTQVVRRLAVAGEILSATAAETLGLIDHLRPAGESLLFAMDLATKIRDRAPVATLVAKQMINAAEGEDAPGALDALASAWLATTADLSEGVTAFGAKRPPVFGGR